MKYLTIDGDDIGQKITSFYLSNDKVKLKRLSEELTTLTLGISKLLTENEFNVIFCAADGVVASTVKNPDFQVIYQKISELPTSDITFSMGVGNTLKEAYVALLYAKSNGKNRLHIYSEIPSNHV